MCFEFEWLYWAQLAQAREREEAEQAQRAVEAVAPQPAPQQQERPIPAHA